MTRKIERIAVFCGSNSGDGEGFKQGAAALGRAIGGQGIGLVYGGTHMGLMGVLADAALEAGGHVHGVITARLQGRGHLHTGLSQHEVHDTIRQRKERMLSLADACIALPGGIGTLEEFMEAWTVNQLEEGDRPLGLLNIEGFYDPFVAFIDGMIARRFLPPAHRDAIVVDADPEALIAKLRAYERVTAPKWMS